MDSIEVAAYLARSTDLTTHHGRMRLQKLLYYVEGWSLAWTGQSLLDDQFEAWIDGPVIDRVWRAELPGRSSLPARVRRHVDEIVEFYGSRTGAELSRLTHEEPPWRSARAGLGDLERSRRPLSKAEMRQHFLAGSLQGTAPARPAEAGGPAADADVEREATAARRRYRGALDELAGRSPSS